MQYITLVSSWSWVRDGCSLPRAESALHWPLGTGPLLCVSVEAAGGFPITHSCVSVMMRKDGTPRLLGDDTGEWWGFQMLPDRPPTPPSGYSFIPAASSDQWLHQHCEWWPLRNLPHSFGILRCWLFFNVTVKPLHGRVTVLSCCWLSFPQGQLKLVDVQNRCCSRLLGTVWTPGFQAGPCSCSLDSTVMQSWSTVTGITSYWNFLGVFPNTILFVTMFHSWVAKSILSLWVFESMVQ